MMGAMRRVMGLAVGKVKGMCANAADGKCPIMEKMCPWMKQNKEVSLGMLVAKVEPWKFAFGFCRAMKMNKHGGHQGRHHHGHGGRHHHGHEGWHNHGHEGWHHHGHDGWHHHGDHGSHHHGDHHGHDGRHHHG